MPNLDINPTIFVQPADQEASPLSRDIPLGEIQNLFQDTLVNENRESIVKDLAQGGSGRRAISRRGRLWNWLNHTSFRLGHELDPQPTKVVACRAS